MLILLYQQPIFRNSESCFCHSFSPCFRFFNPLGSLFVKIEVKIDLLLSALYNAPRCQDTILKKISYRSFRVLMVKLPAHTSCNKRHPGIHHQWMSGACRCCIPAYSA